MKPKDKKPAARRKPTRSTPATATAELPDKPAVAVPARSVFPIVGIGASAGGLAAFEAFFSGMPADREPNMAFVLVQHLAPDHKSILTELIRRYTRMQVFEVTDGMVVHPNCAYIIPPNRDMAFLNGSLQLLEPASPRGQRLPIDFFFRSLAQDQHERAVGIIFSGTGSDGTLGVRAIKGEGGMVMVQTPSSTEYDGMPRSAIATGMVDFELPAAEMPAQLIAYTAHAFVQLPIPPLPRAADNAMRKIFIVLRAQTGNDFSHYKPSTIHRRIHRRMSLHQITGLEDYVKLLQQSPIEVEALFHDMLIGVTSFFRDPEAFRALEGQIIPNVLKGKPTGSVNRVWVAGCSTGEEAYSLAIMMVEQMEALRVSHTVQVFATDIDSRAVASARIGIYPASIAEDLTPERLARFFVAEPDGRYRIHKGIRDIVIFSEQNLIKDPPFSKLDLISCRNVMIYLETALQNMLIPLFHSALKPDGLLFLGTSETTGRFNELFDPVDRKAKLYRRKGDLPGLRRADLGGFLTTQPSMSAMHPPDAAHTAFPVKLRLRELTEQTLLRKFDPVGVLINSRGDIFYQHGHSGMYLELAPGETGHVNIFKMAREGLRRELSVALRQAVLSKEQVCCGGLRVKTNTHYTAVNLTILPVETLPASALVESLYLVILEQAPVADENSDEVETPGVHGAEADARIAALTHELRTNEAYLQTSNEELETSNEELKSANEELQSINEEMQSTNEELGTSKEELQSVNEELTTVNTELQTKVTELSRANNDMNNLLCGTGIATVFVDYQMRILRFTPGASAIINLIPGDVGRPVSHLVSNLANYRNMVPDIQVVLNTLIPNEIKVQTLNGTWFTMRILPYRTLENVIEGAVITFVDISELKRMEGLQREVNDLRRLAVVVRDAHDAITVQDLEGRIVAWNPGATRMYGWTEDEALALKVIDRIPPPLREGAMEKLSRLSRAEILKPYLTRRLAKDGTSVEVSVISTSLVNDAGELYAIATTERTIPNHRTPDPQAREDPISNIQAASEE